MKSGKKWPSVNNLKERGLGVNHKVHEPVPLDEQPIKVLSAPIALKEYVPPDWFT